MKILLLQPNTRYCFNTQAMAVPPLGLLYLAGTLRAAGFPDVSVLDARAKRMNRKELKAALLAAAPDLVGVTGFSTDSEEVFRAARLAKECAPGCKVVLGGPFPSSAPLEALSSPAVDFAVRGEGERPLGALVRALASGLPVDNIPGLVYRGPAGPVLAPPPENIADADSIPAPAWDLLPLGDYYGSWTRHTINPFAKRERVLQLFTSRGCPYACAYCHNIFGKRTRFRSVGPVLDELEALVTRYRAEEVEIIDDIFNLDLDRAKRICDGIVERGIKVALSFPNGLRADRMDEELVLKMKAAGVYKVYYAVETASPRLQRLISKNLDLNRAAEIVRFTAASGIKVGGFFMLGFPGETPAEMLATAAYARRLPFHFATFFYVTPRENTPLYELAGASGSTSGKGNYFLLTKNYSATPDLLYLLIMKWAVYGFYLRPWQLPRTLAAVPNYLYPLKVLIRAFLMRAWA